MATNISIKMIAEAARVSPGTASLVLNHKADQYRISEKTQEKVWQAAEALGYLTGTERRVKKPRFAAQLLCIFCPLDFSKGPAITFFSGARQYITEKKLPYELLLFPYEPGHLAKHAAWLCSDFMAGAIMLALGESDLDFLENSQFDIPIILYNRTAKGFCSVLTDDFAVGYRAMTHFLNRGHRHFAVLAPSYFSRSCDLRIAGFQSKFQSQSFLTDAGSIFSTTYGSDDNLSIAEAVKQLLKSMPRPTAIFLPNDTSVAEITRAILIEGYSIPGDFEIISYGNDPVNAALTPAVTSFAPPNLEMSYNCIRLLCQHITDGQAPSAVKLSCEAELCFRESCPE